MRRIAIGHERAPLDGARNFRSDSEKNWGPRWSRLDAEGILEKRRWGGNGEVRGGCGESKGRGDYVAVRWASAVVVRSR